MNFIAISVLILIRSSMAASLNKSRKCPNSSKLWEGTLKLKLKLNIILVPNYFDPNIQHFIDPYVSKCLRGKIHNK